MKFGMILLILVMLCSLAGSLIPQQAESMRYVEAYGASAAEAFMKTGLTDIFHAWYFYALEGLLCLNLTLCSIVRFPKARKGAERLREKAWAAEADHPLAPGQVEKLSAYLSRRHYKKEEKDGEILFAKNAAGFFGSFLTHLSILLVLLFGALVLLTPDVSDRTVMPGSTLALEDGTKITCESFHIQDASGKLDYASVLRAESADGRESKTQEIRVNRPLRFGEYKIYQQTYGTAGRVRVMNRKNGAEEIMYLTEPCFLSIDGQNGIYFNALYPGYVKDETGNYTLITNTSGSYPDPVYRIQSISGGMSAAVLAFPGEEINIGNITFAFLDPAEYPGLRIKRQSAALYAGLYFSFGLMVAGLYLCFFAVPVCVKAGAAGYAVVSPKTQQGLLIELKALLADGSEEN